MAIIVTSSMLFFHWKQIQYCVIITYLALLVIITIITQGINQNIDIILFFQVAIVACRFHWELERQYQFQISSNQSHDPLNLTTRSNICIKAFLVTSVTTCFSCRSLPWEVKLGHTNVYIRCSMLAVTLSMLRVKIQSKIANHYTDGIHHDISPIYPSQSCYDVPQTKPDI